MAVDSGTRLVGYAAIIDYKPIALGIFRSSRETLIERAVELGHLIANAVPYELDGIVVERPVIRGSSRYRPSDILDLGIATGAIAAVLAAAYECPVELWTPKDWKGSTPKTIDNARTAAKCPEAVALIEKTVLKTHRNHVYDALGIARAKEERVRNAKT